MTAAEAARFGDVVVVSVLFGRYRKLPTEGVAGKVVIDTNNYYLQRDGHFDPQATANASASRARAMMSSRSERLPS